MSRRRVVLVSVALAALPLFSLLTPIAHAKPWAKLAPAPLASDSSFLALSARPSDSLTASQLLWVAVQRDWRAQRDEEALAVRTRGDSGGVHEARSSDKRFAALASRPYAQLTDTEREWLVAENQMQRTRREEPDGSSAVGLLLLGGIAGAVVAVLLIAHAVGNIKFP